MIAFFFFNDTATTEIYTLSLHDALPIYIGITRNNRKEVIQCLIVIPRGPRFPRPGSWPLPGDRKSTRLNSSYANISYAVFCLKKKNTISDLLASSLLPHVARCSCRTLYP